MQIKFSLAVITLNEQKNIKDFIEQFYFVDEIILVDSFSQDDTILIAEKYPKVKIFKNLFLNFTDQKNFAINKCSNNWILFFDADERINSDFKEELYKKIQQQKYYAFYMKRICFIKNKKLNFSGFQNDKVVRIINKNYCKYSEDKLVHEQIKTTKKIGEFTSKINHFFFDDTKSFEKKLDLYARLAAEELYNRRYKINFISLYIKPIFRFLHHFLFRFGFLDGKNGILIALIFMRYVKKRYLYLKTININK